MVTNKLVTFLLSTILLNNIVQSMEDINKPNELEIKQNKLEFNLATQQSILDKQIPNFCKKINYNNYNLITRLCNKMFEDYRKNPEPFFNNKKLSELCKNYDDDRYNSIYNKFAFINALQYEEILELIKDIMQNKLEIYNLNNELNNIKSEIEIKKIQYEEEKQKHIEDLQKQERQITEEIDKINESIKDIELKIAENKANIFNVLFNKIADEHKINKIMAGLNTILATEDLQNLIINYNTDDKTVKKYDNSFKGTSKKALDNVKSKGFGKDTRHAITGNKKNNNNQNNNNNNDLRKALSDNGSSELYNNDIIKNMKNIINFNKELNILQSNIKFQENKLKELMDEIN